MGRTNEMGCFLGLGISVVWYTVGAQAMHIVHINEKVK